MTKSKRIAIQLFGHLRTFQYTFPYFKKNVLDVNKANGYEIDIFIHTWDELDHSTINYRNLNGGPLTQKMLTQNSIALVEQLYKPKSILIEPQLNCDDEIFIEKIGQFPRAKKGCLNNAYTIYSANKLRNEYQKLTSVDYDWVIVTRPDIQFKSPFCIDQILECYTKFELDIPVTGLFYGFNPFGRGNMIEEPQFLVGSDLVFFSSPNNIDKATGLYTEFYENTDASQFYCMEIWWANYWKKKGLTPFAINYKHGPNFDVIKTSMLNDNSLKKDTKIKYYKWLILLFLLNLLPYCVVERKVNKLKKKIGNMVMEDNSIFK
ncbi:hypothetical protein PT273_06630 [Orbaceae bacterium ESL0727]|nr:hypothetical protein [Orbaceae bacterium ESL0727]